VGSTGKVTVLEEIKPAQKLGRWLLQVRGVKVTEVEFFAGHIKTADGESVSIATRRIAAQLALVAAKEIIQSDSLLFNLNEAYKRNTILLFVARQLIFDIEYIVQRVLVVGAINNSCPCILWIKRPILFDEKIISELIPGVEIRYYEGAKNKAIIPIQLALHVLRDLKFISGIGKRKVKKFDWTVPYKPTVLMMQEDTFRADRSLRGQPHWLDANEPGEKFKTCVIKLSDSTFAVEQDEKLLASADIYLLSSENCRYALNENRKNKILLTTRLNRIRCLKAIFKPKRFSTKYFLLQVAFLLRQAQLMGAMALSLNTKVFLIRESYYSYSDAIQLVAPDLGITTVAYQYSNLGAPAMEMLTTADKLLIFSKMYEDNYKIDGISPKEFVSVGYLYNNIPNIVCKKAIAHRDILSRAGAKFIVCYLDESVQHDRWGLVSQSDHLHEIHSLARMILTDQTFGVVIKSQFMWNTPSNLYPNDAIISAAKASGRYLELADGIHRNDIYPAEAALVADFCIGHKFGATAALEAAIAGVRTVLLDCYGTKTNWDDLYAQVDIEYQTMEQILEKMELYRSGNVAQALGDWGPILHHFDPYQDGSAVKRLGNTVRSLALSV
jgi:hypothetical protein